MKRRLTAVALLAVLGGGAHAAAGPVTPVDPLHKRLLTLDTHIDSTVHFAREDWSFGDRHDPTAEIAQVDIPRMADGNLDGGFFSIFTPQGPLTPEGYSAARAWALKRSAMIDSMVAQSRGRVRLARRAADARAIDKGGRLIAFKSIENSYPFGESIAPLAEFQRLGVRLAGPVHTKNNQFADSSTDTPRWNGLSPLGRDWVAEMNRLGMVIDGSHASDTALEQMIELSKTPLLLSHTVSRAQFNHPRNLDDARIRKLAAAGGAMCYSAIYLSDIQMTPEREALFAKLEHVSDLSAAEQSALSASWHALNATSPMWKSTFDQYMAGLLHTIEVAGVDHVCFGADFDGGGGMAGLEEVSALPRVTAALKAAGYSDADLAKMWSGNILRILGQAERHARSLRRPRAAIVKK
ncbi:dipeptidase [Massilia sp. TWR1-2-2]|uniref:dipeptidase n=1 Tax=Massilia sp. TWR1-2-2 TaxID=2804584 RepID=UPI003CF03DBB